MNNAYVEILKKWLGDGRRAVDAEICRICDAPWEGVPDILKEAMCYSLKAGGKRIRPILCMGAAQSCGMEGNEAMPMAMAHEIIHTASLIHDDLPCMDNDDMRRGKPTNHKVYGYAMAVLAGDAMFPWPFEHAIDGLMKNGVDASLILKGVHYLARSVGPAGICGGQALDMQESHPGDHKDTAWTISGMKTAALIRSSVVTGAIVAGADCGTTERYASYGTHLGMAFQIVDDILDVISTSKDMGKTVGKDEVQDKMTFVSLYGLDGAKRMALEESRSAIKAIALPGNHMLTCLAEYLVDRTR